MIASLYHVHGSLFHLSVHIYARLLHPLSPSLSPSIVSFAALSVSSMPKDKVLLLFSVEVVEEPDHKPSYPDKKNTDELNRTEPKRTEMLLVSSEANRG